MTDTKTLATLRFAKGRAALTQINRQRARLGHLSDLRLADAAAAVVVGIGEQVDEAILGLKLDRVVDELVVLVGLEVVEEAVVMSVEAREDVHVVEAERGHDGRERL